MLSREFRIQKAAAATSAEKADDVPHELTNIRVEEVSLVDAPANRRKFLVTKRDKKTEKGVVRVIDATDNDAPWAELDRADAARAKVAKETGDAGEVKPEPPKATEAPAAEPEPPAPAPAPAPEPDKPAPAPAEDDPDKTPAPVTPPAPATPPEPATKIIEEVTAKADDPADIEKVGRPMNRARLQRMKEAFKTLADLLSELDVSEEKAAKAEEPAAPAPVAPAPTAPAPAAPIEAVKADANAAEIKRLTTMIESLQKMVEQQGVQLAKSRQPVDSNVISLEKSNFARDNVTWDADMAAPHAKIRGRSF
jgi:hypothetical protein